MKRVLIISYDFPPCSSPGAAVRAAKFAKYLPRFGWQASVVTRQETGFAYPDDDLVIRIPMPVQLGWSYQISAAAWASCLAKHFEQLSRRHFDLVFVTCPPFAVGLAARSFAQKRKIPLVVDFRDAWSLDPMTSGNVLKRSAKRFLCHWVYPRLERKLLHSANAFITNTPSMKREYEKLLGLDPARFHLIPNGFDEADFQASPPTRLAEPTMLYCGRFVDVGGRSPSLVFAGLKRYLKDAQLKIKLSIVGDASQKILALIHQFGLQEAVSLTPTIPHSDAIDHIRSAHYLLVYQEESLSKITPVAGKTFEYLRSGIPIFGVVPSGDNEKLISDMDPRSVCVTSRHPDDVATGLAKLIDSNGIKPLVRSPSEDFLSKYSRMELTRRLASVFDRLVDGHSPCDSISIGDGTSSVVG